jgi:hypothetical protein
MGELKSEKNVKRNNKLNDKKKWSGKKIFAGRKNLTDYIYLFGKF